MGEVHADNTIAGRFVIERRVASTNMGRVYRARDTMTGAEVALKTSHGDLARFEREIRLLATLEHPHIVRYVAHGATDEGEPWVAMDWIDGETLGRLLSRRTLAIDECVTIGRAIADALAAAHARGIVHRDVKPGNVMLEGGRIDAVRLIDFGIARAENEQTISTGSTIIGTPSYMAPEQARGEHALRPTADIFALGAVLYRCLAERPPFIGEGMIAVLAKVILEDPIPLGELRPDVPPALEELVTAMMAKEPSRRPADGKTIVARFDALPTRRAIAHAPARELTGQELRVASVVMVGPPVASERVRAALERELGSAARIERVRDGSMVVLVRGRGTAADEATGAANAALAVRAIDRDVPIAIATGSAELAGDRPPVGEVIDGAGSLLRSTNLGLITLDGATESLLDARFARREKFLVGRADGDGGRKLLGRVTPFVGRSAELATTLSVVTQSGDESMAKALLVVGAAGSGKSRLRHELLSRVHEASLAEVWSTRADPMGSQTALGLASHLLRNLAAVREGDDREQTMQRLRERIARSLDPEDVERVAMFLGQSIGIDAGAKLGAVGRDPVLLGDQIRRAWMDFLDAETEAHPILIVLEDLHWADRPSVALFDAALSVFAERPIAIVGFARPDVDQTFPGLFAERSMQRVHLGPLPRRAAEELVRTMLGTRPPDEVARLVETSGGNAFYLEELIRSAAEGRDALPQSVLAMVQSRLEALDADDRRLLRAASIFGRVFWEEGVATLLGKASSVAEVQRRVARLVTTEIVTRRRDSMFANTSEVVFRHALLREGAYAMLTPADRVLGHRLAGEWLEATKSTDAAAIAEHFERGEQAARASSWFLQAADDALEANDLEGAVDLAARARASCKDDATLGRIFAIEATALRWQGRLHESLRSALGALRLLPPGSRGWCDAQAARATALLATGRGGEMLVLDDEVRPLLEDPSASGHLLDAAAHIGRCLFQAGHAEIGEAMLKSVEQHIVEDPVLRGRVVYARSIHALYGGETSTALAMTLDAIRLLDDGADARMAVSARINVGYSYSSLGQFARAEVLIREALKTAERLGLVTAVIGAKENLGFTVARLGRLDEGAAIERDAVAASVRTGDRRFEGGARTYLSGILLELGDSKRAEMEAREAIEVVRDVPPMRACALAGLADVLLATGRNAEALDATRRAIEIVESGGVSEEEGTIRLTHAKCLWANDLYEDARRAIAKAASLLRDRAARIENADLRRSFLENVPEHASTFRLAAEWQAQSGTQTF